MCMKAGETMSAVNLTDTFRDLCRTLHDHSDVLYSEFTEEKKTSVFTLYFRAVKVQLVYCQRWEILAPPSVLFSRICFSKNGRTFVHLPEIIAHLGLDDYRACYFPYLETPERMECAFHALWHIVEDYIPIATDLAVSGDGERLIRKSHWENFFDDKAEPEFVSDEAYDLVRQNLEDMSFFFESLLVGRHSDLDAYQAFLLGNWDKALKQYRKMEKSGLSAYERGLCRFMADPTNLGFEPMPPECSAIAAYKKHQKGLHDLWGMLLLWVPFSVLMCAILAIGNWYWSRDTLYSFGSPLWFGLIMAAFPALFGYGAFQMPILKLLKLKEALAFCALTDKKHPIMERIIRLLFVVSLVVSLGFTGWISSQCDRFYEDHAICINDEGEYARFEYSQIDSICYINSRYNEFDGRVERASYVIVLEDGTCFDLDANQTERQQERLIEALFPDRQIITLDSDRDLHHGCG